VAEILLPPWVGNQSKCLRLQAVTPGNDNLLSQCCTSTFLCECAIAKKYWWFDWFSMIAVAASFRQDFELDFCPPRTKE